MNRLARVGHLAVVFDAAAHHTVDLSAPHPSAGDAAAARHSAHKHGSHHPVRAMGHDGVAAPAAACGRSAREGGGVDDVGGLAHLGVARFPGHILSEVKRRALTGFGGDVQPLLGVDNLDQLGAGLGGVVDGRDVHGHVVAGDLAGQIELKDDLVAQGVGEGEGLAIKGFGEHGQGGDGFEARVRAGPAAHEGRAVDI